MTKKIKGFKEGGSVSKEGVGPKLIMGGLGARILGKLIKGFPKLAKKGWKK
jgi:hypothetical protein